VKSTTLRFSGVSGDAGIARVLSNVYCARVLDTAFTEVGVASRRDATWIILAAPFAPPTKRDEFAVRERALDLVNAARSTPRRCGTQPFAAVPPMRASPLLEAAAEAHALDMAERDYFEHAGADGSTPAERVGRTGYRWRVVGENLAAGPTTAEDVVAGWLASPHHCANMMDGRFTEMGLAYAVDRRSTSGIYWAQVFGTPK